MPLTTIRTSNLDTTNSLFFRNRIINGDMRIDQRNAGASFTNSNQNLVGIDRWRNFGLSSAVLTIQQSTVAPAGFFNSQSVTVTTSTTANDSGGLGTRIEGNNVFDFNWGTSSGSSVTASFWVRSSVTGTYNVLVSFSGSSNTYYYVATYTINATNTWEYKTITITAPPTAAGAFTAALNTQYLEFRFVISSSGGSSTTANTWSTSTLTKSSGCVDLASNAGATFYITGVQLEVGTAATAFERRPFGTELQLCQRYFEKSYDVGVVPGTTAVNGYIISPTGTNTVVNNVVFNGPSYKVNKRITNPTIVIYGYSGGTGKVSGASTGADLASNSGFLNSTGESTFSVYNFSGSTLTTNSLGVIYHFTSSAEL